jgi:hypothetical protein
VQLAMLARRSVGGHAGGVAPGTQSVEASAGAGSVDVLPSTARTDAVHTKAPPVQTHVAGVPKAPHVATRSQLCASVAQAAPLAAA